MKLTFLEATTTKLMSLKLKECTKKPTQKSELKWKKKASAAKQRTFPFEQSASSQSCLENDNKAC